MVIIREENAADYAAVDRVNERAFGRREEAELVAMLHRSGKIILSLVALQDEQVVGHILFTPMRIKRETGPDVPAVGIGPVAVLPEFQRSGIGSVLMEKGLEQCRLTGQRIVFVLGHPAYYPRFGFQPANQYGIRCAYDVPEDAFMVLELEPGALKGISGIAHYQLEFDGV